MLRVGRMVGLVLKMTVTCGFEDWTGRFALMSFSSFGIIVGGKIEAHTYLERRQPWCTFIMWFGLR